MTLPLFSRGAIRAISSSTPTESMVLCRSRVRSTLQISRPSPAVLRPVPSSEALLHTTSKILAKKSTKGKGKSRSDDSLDDSDDLPPLTSSKGKGKSRTSTFDDDDPSSSGSLPNLEALQDGVLEKARTRMGKVVDHFRGQAFDAVERGRGRPNPALLNSVRVLTSASLTNPKSKATEPLEGVASVTVVGGQSSGAGGGQGSGAGGGPSGLKVEVFDKETMKRVLSAITHANLPGIAPNKVGDLELFVPVGRPTEPQRLQTLKQITSDSESSRVQIRTARTDALKGLKALEKDGGGGGTGGGSGGKGGKGAKGGGGKGGGESGVTKEVQDLTDKHTAQIDEVVASAKKELAKA